MAKIRLGFVSNSSSSSFVFGYKDTDNLEKLIKEMLNKNKDCLKNFLDEATEYSEYGNELNNLKTEEEKLSFLTNILTDEFVEHFEYTKPLGEWNICSFECSSETDKTINLFLEYLNSYHGDSIYIENF